MIRMASFFVCTADVDDGMCFERCSPPFLLQSLNAFFMQYSAGEPPPLLSPSVAISIPYGSHCTFLETGRQAQ